MSGPRLGALLLVALSGCSPCEPASGDTHAAVAALAPRRYLILTGELPPAAALEIRSGAEALRAYARQALAAHAPRRYLILTGELPPAAYLFGGLEP